MWGRDVAQPRKATYSTREGTAQEPAVHSESHERLQAKGTLRNSVPSVKHLRDGDVDTLRAPTELSSALRNSVPSVKHLRNGDVDTLRASDRTLLRIYVPSGSTPESTIRFGDQADGTAQVVDLADYKPDVATDTTGRGPLFAHQRAHASMKGVVIIGGKPEGR